MGYLIGIDIGTSAVKVIVMDHDDIIAGTARSGYDISRPVDGYAKQHPETWWKAVIGSVGEVLVRSGIRNSDIDCIGLSGQMHGMVPVDSKRHCVRPAIIWCDKRTEEQVRKVYCRIGEEDFRKITLNPLSTGFQLVSLLWVKEHEPDIYDRIYKVILPKDFIKMKLTSGIGTDYTDASATMTFDTALLKWSELLIEKLELDIKKYPVCSYSHEIAGYVTDEAAFETGLKAGTPVVCGGGDQQMQAVGNGMVQPGTICANIGTGGQISTLSDRPLYDEKGRIHTFCHAVPGMWVIMGASLCSGLSLSWLRENILCGTDYEKIDSEAARTGPGSGGLVFLPYLLGERTPHMDPHAKGMFFGITLKHTWSHIARAVMEGVAFSLRDSLEIFRDMGITPDKIIASGGGAKSALWAQIQADIFKSEIYISKFDEQACLGAAITAGVGISVYGSIQEGCRQTVRFRDERYHPESNNFKAYDMNYDIYKELYINNKGLFKKTDLHQGANN